MTNYKGCNYCRHFRPEGTCPAFDPGLIPMGIVDGRIKHTEPLASQKNTIVYEATEKWIGYRLKTGDYEPPRKIQD
ncbi:cytoplasmic protein [Microcoleus sp. herbarium19]|uniref:cytoplasmic protein n=1 Tax=unclassified Microcoleus TaxID=2642155 RepID=UPI002FCF825B